ncbi:hypothetical protein PHYBLDRAFT_176300 [Phycomyces blakesleeanus NRRL 1555(-)]|uniref:Uncharacterized protein n=1 Tax=Phycomyces blakesleeanus (strain ATCC 8743b / DSM 1359 / FGSC 10004 / NBRC 33097 / NRRL 1555) TaxID=763407 RepID=A0A162T9J0_PHYB8|nr:hypothetical protein PHYBLDRAFT_176300 [Phycomyces blakesleeanus NRRL 1555(-)]OAD65253.1 hypothetical protein PHYBLDRAFT_176300 [Phycomyces blakesleeanus NRRL 1555(-)]|eukprot:XP_018283293.1 hypothetical protein PHYBLDRAFT_176300 [Phycomyces blakesleeanus NRRL 1555(-)]
MAPIASIALLFLCSSATFPTSLLPPHRANTSLLSALLPSNLRLQPPVVQHFPLAFLWMYLPPFVEYYLSLKTLLVSDAFSIKEDSCFARKSRSTFSWACNYIGQFFWQLDSGNNARFGEACTGSLSRHIRSTSKPPPSLSIQWHKFWSVLIPHHCLTVWYVSATGGLMTDSLMMETLKMVPSNSQVFSIETFLMEALLVGKLLMDALPMEVLEMSGFVMFALTFQSLLLEVAGIMVFIWGVLMMEAFELEPFAIGVMFNLLVIFLKKIQFTVKNEVFEIVYELVSQYWER